MDPEQLDENLSPAQKRYLPGVGSKWVRTKQNVAVRLSREGSGGPETTIQPFVNQDAEADLSRVSTICEHQKQSTRGETNKMMSKASAYAFDTSFSRVCSAPN